MGLTEIILIIVGAIALVISYVLPAGKSEKDMEQVPKMDEKMIRSLVEKEIEGAKSHMNDMVDETLNYSMEKTERAMERLTNEKIMAVNEYSEQVLAAINKNHQEVMFLYDMLNDKHENLVNTVSEASKKAKEIKQTLQDAEITVKEAAEMIAVDAETVAGDIETPEAEGRNTVENTKQEQEAASRTEMEHAQGMDEVDFIPIAPKRAELVQGMIQETEEAYEDSGMEPPTESELEEDKNYNNNEKILRLHKLGKSKTAIAKELGLGVGEVKLVIDLFEQA